MPGDCEFYHNQTRSPFDAKWARVRAPSCFCVWHDMSQFLCRHTFQFIRLSGLLCFWYFPSKCTLAVRRTYRIAPLDELLGHVYFMVMALENQFQRRTPIAHYAIPCDNSNFMWMRTFHWRLIVAQCKTSSHPANRWCCPSLNEPLFPDLLSQLRRIASAMMSIARMVWNFIRDTFFHNKDMKIIIWNPIWANEKSHNGSNGM